jgi:hypothetical protein
MVDVDPVGLGCRHLRLRWVSGNEPVRAKGRAPGQKLTSRDAVGSVYHKSLVSPWKVGRVGLARPAIFVVFALAVPDTKLRE